MILFRMNLFQSNYVTFVLALKKKLSKQIFIIIYILINNSLCQNNKIDIKIVL